jgi:hypothetical protein
VVETPVEFTNRGNDQIMTNGTAVDVTERVARIHYDMTSAHDPVLSDDTSPAYRASRDLLLALIGAAYPDVAARDVYDVWCGRHAHITHCVDIVRADMVRRDATPAHPANTGPEWLTAKQAAERAGRHVVVVRAALVSGELHGHQRCERGRWSVCPASVDAWIASDGHRSRHTSERACVCQRILTAR